MQSLRVRSLAGAPALCRANRCSARHVSASASVDRSQQAAKVATLTVATTLPSMAFYQALADEIVPAIPEPGTASPLQSLILLAPVILYGLFTVYRTSFNPRASIGDFFFFVIAAVVIGNIGSILILKQRLF